MQIRCSRRSGSVSPTLRRPATAAVLRTDVLPQWLGWAAIAGGLAIPAIVLVTREIFPHLALPVFMALGVGLLVTAGS